VPAATIWVFDDVLDKNGLFGQLRLTKGLLVGRKEGEKSRAARL
jgi:hypothetical protein